MSIVEQNKIFRTADICDAYADAGVIDLAFIDYGQRSYFQGTAVTYTTYEDISGIKDILGQNGEGKVLVVDGRGSMKTALCGGKIATKALDSGWEGLIFYGAIRDQHELAEIQIGIKALGSSPMRPSDTGLGKLTPALAIGDIVIRAGDYVYADPDGVVVLPEKV